MPTNDYYLLFIYDIATFLLLLAILINFIDTITTTSSIFLVAVSFDYLSPLYFYFW